MINYYIMIYTIIEFIDKINMDNKNLKKLYYLCCINGGYESYDYIIHEICEILLSNEKLNLEIKYYYKYFVDIKKKLKKTKKNLRFYKENELNKYINFIIDLKNYINIDNDYFIKKLNKHNTNNNNEIYENTLSLRGIYQKINQCIIYNGNFNKFGPVKNYNINNNDIRIIKKILKNESNLNKINLMLQTPIINRNFSRYYTIREGIILDNNINIYGTKNLKERDEDIISNLITSLYYYGDCREHSLIYLLILTIKEYDKFIELFNNNKITDIKKLILNQNRIIDINMYLNSHYEYNQEYKKYFNSYKELKNNDELNNYEKKNYEIFDNNKYIYIENHSLVLEDNNNKFTLKDIMYKKKDIELNETYKPDYVLNNSTFKKKNNYYQINEKNIYNNDINQIFTLNKSIFKQNINFTDENLEKLTFLNNKFNENILIFDNINDYILKRELHFNKILNKVFKKYIKNNKKINNFLWILNIKKSIPYNKNDNNQYNIHYFLE